MPLDATFFALVALIIFLGIVAYAGGFKTMTSGLDTRAERIRNDLEQAAKLRKEAEALLAEYKQKRIDAEKEAAIVEGTDSPEVLCATCADEQVELDPDQEG